MKTEQIWINLPVKDLVKSKAFFMSIGFSFTDERENNEMLAMKVGKHQLPVMLFKESTFKEVIQHEVTDTSKSTEVLFSFSAASRKEVDEVAETVKKAGGHVFAKPAEIQGWMYGCAFTDLDGHRWNALYMDKN